MIPPFYAFNGFFRCPFAPAQSNDILLTVIEGEPVAQVLGRKAGKADKK
jgi:uncharacterized protein (DUF1684 family)